MKITVATCQFPIDSDIKSNFRHISRQIKIARERGAEITHFPEAGLSGYAGVDFKSFDGFDWELLRECTLKVLDLAHKFKVWIILGSAHRLTGKHKPHNCLYIINNCGQLLDRYDKMFCAGDQNGKTGDLAHYTSGNHFSVFDINGLKCGALICHDYRYPELYREYKRRSVQLMFHSYHAGHINAGRFKSLRDDVGEKLVKLNPGPNIPSITMPAAMHVAAADNYMWISCPNSSARESCWPSFFVRPDGVITGRLRINITGVLISVVDTDEKLYDSTVAWRENAMCGVYHSGELVNDMRSAERTLL